MARKIYYLVSDNNEITTEELRKKDIRKIKRMAWYEIGFKVFKTFSEAMQYITAKEEKLTYCYKFED